MGKPSRNAYLYLLLRGVIHKMASSAQNRIKKISYAKYGYMFILPFFIVYFIFAFYPLIQTFIMAFQTEGEATQYDIAMKSAGLVNFKALLFGEGVKDGIIKPLAAEGLHEDLVRTLGNTFKIWFINFLPQIILSLILAVWFTDQRLKIKGKGFFKVVMYMPNIITASSVAALFLVLFGSSRFGTANAVLIQLGKVTETATFDFVKHKTASPLIVSFIQMWMWYGNTMILLMSGILGISPSLFEAANIDGANGKQVFFKITLPILRPILLYTVITSMIGGMQMFDIPMLYNTGQNINKYTETIAVFIYGKFSNVQNRQYGISSAASLILFAITAVMGSVVFYMNRDKDAIARKNQLKKLKKRMKEQSKNRFGGAGL